MAEKKLMKGNEAIAEAAIRAGLKFFAGYPITPQSELLEYISAKLPAAGGEFVQAESEVAASNMIMGASIGGARCMTATSGPGLSLMAEVLANLSEGSLPSVIIDVMRSQGNITPSQADYNYMTKSLGHGGMRGFVMAPSTVQQAADMTFEAFDIADRYHTPVIILLDGMIGQMMEAVELPEPKTPEDLRGYVIPNGAKGRPRRFETASALFYKGLPFEEALDALSRDKAEMYLDWEKNEARYKTFMMEDAEYAVVAYGSAARIAIDAVRQLREEGIMAGLFQPLTLFPFPGEAVAELASLKGTVTAEMVVPAQFDYDVVHYLPRGANHGCYARFGLPLEARGIVEEVRRIVRNAENAAFCERQGR